MSVKSQVSLMQSNSKVRNIVINLCSVVPRYQGGMARERSPLESRLSSRELLSLDYPRALTAVGSPTAERGKRRAAAILPFRKARGVYTDVRLRRNAPTRLRVVASLPFAFHFVTRTRHVPIADLFVIMY